MIRYSLIAVGLFLVSPSALAQTKLVACPLDFADAMDGGELIETNDLGATLAELDLSDEEIEGAFASIEVEDARRLAVADANELQAVRAVSAVARPIPIPIPCGCRGGWVHIHITSYWNERRHEKLCSGRTVCGQSYDCTYGATYGCQRTLHIWWCPTTGRYYVYSGPKLCRPIACTQPVCN